MSQLGQKKQPPTPSKTPKKAAQNAEKGASGALGSVKDTAGGATKAAGDTASGATKQAPSPAKDVGKKVGDTAGGATKQAPSPAKDVGKKAGDTAKDVGGKTSQAQNPTTPKKTPQTKQAVDSPTKKVGKGADTIQKQGKSVFPMSLPRCQLFLRDPFYQART